MVQNPIDTSRHSFRALARGTYAVGVEEVGPPASSLSVYVDLTSPPKAYRSERAASRTLQGKADRGILADNNFLRGHHRDEDAR